MGHEQWALSGTRQPGAEGDIHPPFTHNAPNGQGEQQWRKRLAFLKIVRFRFLIRRRMRPTEYPIAEQLNGTTP